MNEKFGLLVYDKHGPVIKWFDNGYKRYQAHTELWMAGIKCEYIWQSAYVNESAVIQELMAIGTEF